MTNEEFKKYEAMLQDDEVEKRVLYSVVFPSRNASNNSNHYVGYTKKKLKEKLATMIYVERHFKFSCEVCKKRFKEEIQLRAHYRGKAGYANRWATDDSDLQDHAETWKRVRAEGIKRKVGYHD